MDVSDYIISCVNAYFFCENTLKTSSESIKLCKSDLVCSNDTFENLSLVKGFLSRLFIGRMTENDRSN